MAATTTSRRHYSISCSSPFAAIFEQPSSQMIVRVRRSHRKTSSVVQFSINQNSNSSGHSVSVNQNSFPNKKNNNKKKCMCSPTTHPGSFRCKFHKRLMEAERQSKRKKFHWTASYRLNMRISAMANSLVRIETVKSDEWLKKAQVSTIWPSFYQLRRYFDFRSQKSRLSIVCNADDEPPRV